MKDLIASIFGTYTPVTYQYEWSQWDVATEQYLTMRATKVADGMAGVDWPYVLGVLIFIVSLYCVLRIIGVVINRV